MIHLSLDNFYSGHWIIKLPAKMILKIQKETGYHIIFWISYFTFNVLRWGSYFNDYMYSFKSNMVGFPIHMCLAYLNAYYLLPRFIPKVKYLQYFLSLGLAISVMFFIKVYLNYYFVTSEIWPESYKEEEIFSTNHIIVVMLGELYVIGLTTSIKLTMDWLKNQKRTKELEKKTLETELDFLKSQIQPHFFFNTLNNLYALTLEKSDKAPDIVLKLSDLMSYILYQASDTRRVSLMKEVIQMQNYLDLEKLRFGKRLNLNFDMEGQIEGAEIAPLILLPFIENTFKHGVHNQLTTIDIDIKIQVADNWLTFSITNPKPPENAIPMKIKLDRPSGGLGIKNAKRRLNLLYNNTFDLKIDNLEDKYTVTLKIPSKPMPIEGISIGI